MTIKLLLSSLLIALYISPLYGRTQAVTPISELKAFYRSGQVFITWKEADVPEGTTFNVYAASGPIKSSNLSRAKKVGHHIGIHSGRDWWQDPASFNGKAKSGKPVGFIIEPGGKPIDPSGGLFVHIVTKKTEGKAYFAVTVNRPDGKEDRSLKKGYNTLGRMVKTKIDSIFLAALIYHE